MKAFGLYMKKILIADDDLAMRELVQATLEGPEFEILLASDGHEALQLAIANRPDVVVLDWEMPGMTGAEVTKELRRLPETARIPIVMLTGRRQEHNAGLKLGVNAYLIKPFSPLLLLECLNAAMKHTGNSKARRTVRPAESWN